MSFNWDSKALRMDKSKVAANASLTDRWSDQNHSDLFCIFLFERGPQALGCTVAGRFAY